MLYKIINDPIGQFMTNDIEEDTYNTRTLEIIAN